MDEAERKIEEAYEAEYVDPYALLQGGEQPRLGLPRRGRSSHGDHLGKPKHHRHRGAGPSRRHPCNVAAQNASNSSVKKETTTSVFQMDLSTVEGLEAARTIVQANDIIYVESNPQIGQ